MDGEIFKNPISGIEKSDIHTQPVIRLFDWKEEHGRINRDLNRQHHVLWVFCKKNNHQNRRMFHDNK